MTAFNPEMASLRSFIGGSIAASRNPTLWSHYLRRLRARTVAPNSVMPPSCSWGGCSQ